MVASNSQSPQQELPLSHRPFAQTSPHARTEGTEAGRLVSPESDTEPTLSVVLPTLNEEAGVAECIERIETAVSKMGIPTEVIVSDSSSDRTPEIAREMDAKVVKPDRSGYGYAYRYAFRHTRGEYVAIGDADTTYDFEELPKLVDRLVTEDADIVLGSRLDGEIKSGAMPALHQYIGNPMLTKFLNTFYHADVSDAHSGFRVLTRDALGELDLNSDGMEFASEMLMDASVKSLDIEEVPITYHEREGEATLDSFRDGWRHVRFMLTNAPGYLFSVPGLVFAAIGTVLMTLTALSVEFAGAGSNTIQFGVRSMIAGSLFSIVGLQVAFLGLFSTHAGDPIRRPRDALTTWLYENVTLESGSIVGLAMFVAGGSYAAYVVYRWLTLGYESLFSLSSDVFAFTLIIIGLQIIFSSFFVDVLSEEGV
jgi:glycosyltransferase involved in cell wall biosynthesis